MAALTQLSGAANATLRKGILAAADSRRVQGLVRRHGSRFGAARFVAGETLDECIAVLRRLNEQGLAANTTLLGEGVLEPAQTDAVVAAYREVIARISDEQLQANVALKLTHLGLDIDEELAFENLTTLLARDRSSGSTWSSPSSSTQRCASIGGCARRASTTSAPFSRPTCTARRTISSRCSTSTPNLRLVKGAYLEPEAIAYPHKADVDAVYARLMERMLSSIGHTAIATHDESLIEHAIRYADEHAIGRERFEFQMLYGVRPSLQLDLVRRGYKVLVATPYGPEWYPYLMRRLGERPANLLFFVKNTLRG